MAIDQELSEKIEAIERGDRSMYGPMIVVCVKFSMYEEQLRTCPVRANINPFSTGAVLFDLVQTTGISDSVPWPDRGVASNLTNTPTH